MKTISKPSAIALALVTLNLSPFTFRLLAAVPLAWDVRPGQPAPVMFDRYHGETLSFSATFRGFGELPFSPGADVRLWYQTNGMGAAWWSAPATIRSNVLSAVWSPEMDPGAERVSLFFGAPSNAYAAAVLRLRHSPGFAPGALPDPIAFHESDPVFSEWLATNTLSSTLSATIAEAEARIGAEIVAATNAVRVVRKFDPGVDAWTVSGAMDLRLGKERDGYYVGTSGGKTYALLYTWHEWTFGTAQDNATVAGEPASTNLAFEIGGATYALSKGEWVDVPLATLDDIPSADLTPSTNYTDRALSSFATTGTVARAHTYGTLTRWTDANGDVWEALDVWQGDGVSLIPNGVNAWSSNDDDSWLLFNNGTWTAGIDARADVFSCSGQEDDTSLVMQGEYGTITLNRTITTNLAGRVALTNDIPTVPEWAKEPAPPSYSAADVGAAPASLVQAVTNIQVESALVYRLYSGSNVVAEVTNYNSQVHAPELRLMQLNESNEYITVWTETNGLARTLAKANEYTDAAITNRAAPRAWSKVTAGMGFEAPSNTTWLSTGRTVIAGGLEYEKHMTGGGAIWLLESNGMTADFHAQTNNTAFIDLSNADGTPIFRVEKTDSFLVGVHVDHVTVDGSALVCGVNVVAADHPLVRVKASLESGEWAKEEDGIPASLATVTWSGTTGDWTCRIQNNTGGNTLFAQMEYFQEGGTKIVNSAAMDVSQGILCTDGIHKCRPVYSSAGGGTITWEVVQ